MAAAHEEAFNAIMVALKAEAEEVQKADHLNVTSRASALRDLAAGWRHLRGGAQPGGFSSEK